MMVKNKEKKALGSLNLPRQNVITFEEVDISNLQWVDYLRNTKFRPIVEFEVVRPAENFISNAIGRNARSLLELYLAGNKGITAASASDGKNWAYRLASYVSDLRHKKGLGYEGILTKKEPHQGGEHARYFLTAEVIILEIQFVPVKA